MYKLIKLILLLLPWLLSHLFWLVALVVMLFLHLVFSGPYQTSHYFPPRPTFLLLKNWFSYLWGGVKNFWCTL